MISLKRIRLLSSGKGVIDQTSTYEEFEYVLLLGAITDLDSGTKKKGDLFQETQKCDVKLKYNPFTGRVERHARSVQIIISNPKTRKRWFETARTYPGSDPVVKVQGFTLRETLEVLETSLNGAVRCLLEELAEHWKRLGWWPTASDLTPWKTAMPRGPILSGKADEVDRHESSTYRGILSIVTYQLYELITEKFIGQYEYMDLEIIVTKDTDGQEESKTNSWVWLRLEAFPY